MMISTRPINIKKISELSNFLKARELMSIYELQGFFTSISSGPSVILPSEWMEVIGIRDIEFRSEQQAKQVIGNIMRFYNRIATQLAEKTYSPLLSLHQKAYTPSKIQVHVNAKLWASGYVLGMALDPNQWYFDETEEVLAQLLFPILSLTMTPDKLGVEIKKINLTKTPSDIHQMSIEALPELAMEIYDFWLEKRNDRDRSFFNPLFNKMGRNHPCPCGSGKKYKKCCLH